MEFELSENQRVLLDLVRRYGPVPRVKLSELSGLTPGAITRHCKELLLQGLIKNGEAVTGQRGQPAQPLLLNASGRFSLGVAFYPKQYDLVLIDFCGTVIAQVREAFNENDIMDTAKLVAKRAEDLMIQSGIAKSSILGLGLAIPGFSTGKQQKMRTVEQLSSWRDMDIGSAFDETLGIKTFVENIAATGAQAQLYTNNNPSERNLVFIHLGYGVGAGIVIEGRLYGGRFGNAGEIGGFFPLDAFRPSGLDLLKAVQDAGIAIDRISQIDIQDATTLKVVEHWISKASDQIADIVQGACFWLSPDRIIIGGPQQAELMEKIWVAVTEKVASRASHLPPTPISLADSGPTTTAIGAAFLPIDHYCAPLTS